MAAKTNESLPDVARNSFDARAVLQMVSKVAEHYDVPIAFMALEATDAVYLKACHGTALRRLALGGLACHHISRAVPIIIDDALAEEQYANDPFVTGARVRFCVGAPLMLKPETCVGVLWIMDPKLRPKFTVDDTAFLVQAAQDVMSTYRAAEAAANLWRFKIASLEALPDMLSCPMRAGFSLFRPRIAECAHGKLAMKTNESLPQMAFSSFDRQQVTKIVAQVAQHYDVPIAFMALEGPDAVHLRARHGTALQQLALGGLACHRISRAIPIIIDDALADEHHAEDPLVTGLRVRFCVGAPLMLKPQTCVGALWIMDPRLHPKFSVDDSAFLTQAALDIMSIYRSSAESPAEAWKLSMGSLDSLPESPSPMVPSPTSCGSRIKSFDFIGDSWDCERASAIIARVASHYSVPVCFVALKSGDALQVTARRGTAVRTVGLGSIANHSVSRALPTIIDDVQADGRYRDDPLCMRARFFVKVPLMLSSDQCVGTLCMADGRLRPGFSIDDCEVLGWAAQELVEIYRNTSRSHHLWNFTVDAFEAISTESTLCEMLPEVREESLELE